MGDSADGNGAGGTGAPALSGRAALMQKFATASTDADPSQAPAPKESLPPSASASAQSSPDGQAQDTDDEDLGDADLKAAPTDDEAPDDPEPDDPDDEADDKVEHLSIKRAEVRMRAEMAAERQKMQADLDRAVAEIRPKLERLEKLEGLVSRSKHDTDALVELLELGDDDFEPHAHGLAARSPKWRDKPEMKATSQRMLKEREERAERAAMKARIDKFEADQKAEREASAQEKARVEHIATVTKALDDKTPLAKALQAKNPVKYERMVMVATLDLWESLGRQPKTGEVTREVEKRRAAQKAEFDSGEAAPVEKAVTAAKKADKAAPAKPTNGANGAPPKFKTRDDLFREFAKLGNEVFPK